MITLKEATMFIKLSNTDQIIWIENKNYSDLNNLIDRVQVSKLADKTKREIVYQINWNRRYIMMRGA